MITQEAKISRALGELFRISTAFRQPSGRHPRAASYVGHPASPDHIPRGRMTWRGGR